MRTLFAAATVAFVLAAQSTGAQQAPAPAANANAPDIENGRKVFAFGNTSCSNCHGNGAVGGWGPDLAGKGIPLGRAALAIRRPTWRMPAFDASQVTDKEIADMTAYWASLPLTTKLGNWRTPFPKDVEEKGQLSAVLYGCTQCHGNTLETPRHGQGETDGDFEWFKHQVYEHSKAQPEQWAMLDRENAPSSTPGPGRVRMGNYDRTRLPEATLKEIYDWAFLELGKLVPISARITAAPGSANGTVYTIDVANGAVPNRGLTAEDVTISVIVPPGQKVVAGTGTGYQGVTKQGSDDVVIWKVAKFAPRDRQKFTVTLSGTATGDAAPRGTVAWARPTAKEDAEVAFALPRQAGRGAGD
jgi:mono/diheme cytochrome c family protein